jgi:chemotaxis protein MotB
MSRPKPPAPDEGPGWLATYGDLVTLLMAFFVMLFAISSVEESKFEQLLSGLGPFGNPAATSVLSPLGEPVATPVPVPVPNQPTDDDVPVTPGRGAAGGALDPTLEQLGRRLLEAVDAAGHPGTVEIRKDPRGLALSIATDDVLFAVGATTVTGQGRQILAAIAPSLSTVPNEVLVEGHADSSPLNRGGYTNWNLSTDRAVAVVNVFVGDHGLAPHRLSASGYGQFRPVDPGDGETARSRNRRVELIILHAAPTSDPIPNPIPPIVVPTPTELTS